jgi:hypothetical protein
LQHTSLPIFELEDDLDSYLAIEEEAKTLKEFHFKNLTRKNLISVEFLGKEDHAIQINFLARNYSLNRDVVDSRLIHSL